MCIFTTEIAAINGFTARLILFTVDFSGGTLGGILKCLFVYPIPISNH